MCEQFLKRIEVFSDNFEKHSLYVSEKYFEITEKIYLNKFNKNFLLNNS